MYRMPLCILSFALCAAGAVAACQPAAAVECTSFEDVCEGVCVNLERNSENCGACGAECETDEVCDDGDCVLDCSSREEECDGACVDTDTDVEHCGECDNDCATGEGCDDGKCVLQCGGATPNRCPATPGSIIDGCYNNLTDKDHCGALCVDCATNVPNCTNGVCGA
jgi:hypothetical protein